MNYEEYISSPEWQRKRQLRLEIDKHECRTCGEKGESYRLEVHHKPQSYTRIPHESVEDDLTTLCTLCHNAITDRIRRERFSSRGYTIEAVQVTIKRKVVNNDLEKSRIQVDFIGPASDAQRAIGRPHQQVGKIDEADYIEEKQDRRGLRRNGPD